MTLKKSKKEVEEYIYVVVAKHLTTDEDAYDMECGRIIAQACHVVSKLKLRLGMDPDKETTTIVIQTHYNDDIPIIAEKLVKDKQAFELFYDTNNIVYNTYEPVLTCLATLLTKRIGKKHFGNYNLYSCYCDRFK